MRTQVERQFEHGDPVREYWLTRGEGFAVETPRGRRLGRVVDVVLDADAGRIERLVVRSRGLRAVRGRTEEIPTELVAAAVPARKTFVLDGAGPVAAPARPRGERVRSAWAWLRPRVVAGAAITAGWAARASVTTARAAARVALLAAARGHALDRSAAAYGRVAGKAAIEWARRRWSAWAAADRIAPRGEGDPDRGRRRPGDDGRRNRAGTRRGGPRHGRS